MSSNNPTFIRPGRTSSSYYYNAIEITKTNNIDGIYTFRSISSIDTYGCLYDDYFEPSYSSRNILRCDDDSGGNLQFLISYPIQPGRKYILIVTTSTLLTNGSYSIEVAGPSSIYMISVTPGKDIQLSKWNTITMCFSF